MAHHIEVHDASPSTEDSSEHALTASPRRWSDRTWRALAATAGGIAATALVWLADAASSLPLLGAAAAAVVVTAALASEICRAARRDADDAQTRLHSLRERSATGMCTGVLEGDELRLRDLNPTARKLLHSARGEEPSWRDLLAPGAADEALHAAWLVAEGLSSAWSGDLEHRWPGAVGWLHVTLHRAEGASGSGQPSLLMELVDVTNRKAAEEQLRAASTRDPLTRLPSRAVVEERLAAALEPRAGRTSVVGVLFVDIDEFRLVNDSHGHPIGDEVLQAAARRLQAEVGPHDLVSRLGADEFVVVCPRLTDPEEARRLGERVVEAFAGGLGVPRLQHTPTVSVGIAVSRPGVTAAALLREADHAMAAAKRDGKGRAQVTDPEAEAEADRRTRLLARLRGAVAASEFVLHFQPLIDLESSGMIGVEALCRWQEPERGLLAPSEFLDVIEHSDLVVPFSQWVLRSACQHGAIWQDQLGPSAPSLHVNVSASHLRHKDFAAHVREVLAETRLDPHLLVLEITETQLLATTPALRRDLAGLRAAGVRIAVDDYGTGYSSLSHITDLDVDILKIDRSFVNAMEQSKAARAVVEAVAVMGTTLGMEVVAEGVETCDHAARLRQMGALTGQGYLWSPGLPAEEISRMARQRVGGPAA